MAEKFVEVTMHYVGQGLAQTIEIYNSAGEVQALVVVDFGTDSNVRSYQKLSNKPTAIAGSCKSLKEKVEKRKKIDFLVISHTDRDHINILVSYFRVYAVNVDNVIIGGTPRGRYSLTGFGEGTKLRGGSKLLKDLGEVLRKVQPDINKIKFFSSSTHFFEEIGNEIIPKREGAWRLEGWYFDRKKKEMPQAALRVLTSRHFVNDPDLCRDAAAYINANSVVLVLEVYTVNTKIPSAAIFLTGDIQWTTMVYLTECFGKGGVKCFPFLNDGVQRAMIVPHHGSLKTACKGNSIKKNKDGSYGLEKQLEDLEIWGKNMNCEILLVSAKKMRNRNHPCQQVMECLGNNHLKKAPKVHQNVEMVANLLTGETIRCKYKKLVIKESRAVYTSYAGIQSFGKEQWEMGRNIVLCVKEDGKMEIEVREERGA